MPADIELERLSIRNLAIEYRDARGAAPRLFQIEELAAAAGPAAPLKLELRGVLGEAVLGGALAFGGERPRLEARIRASNVQLDEFPLAAQQAPAPRTPRVERLRAQTRDAVGQIDELLSRAFLRRFDALVDVDVEHVHSGADRLGNGRLRIELADGRLNLEPLEVDLPGGSARLYASYDTSGREIAFAAGARIERLEYGLLARRGRPEADIDG